MKATAWPALRCPHSSSRIQPQTAAPLVPHAIDMKNPQHSLSSTKPSRLTAAARDALHTTESLAADMADRVDRVDGQALRRQAQQVKDDLERRWLGRAQPVAARFSSRAQALARQGLDLAGQAGSQAQASLSRYAGATTDYVARQPMRSVLLAAALGAGLAWLLSSRRRRD